MAFKYDVFTFDEVNKLVIVDAGVTEVTCQQIYNACRNFEGELGNLDLLPLVRAGGKDDLGGGRQVGITLTMINDWRLKFPDEAGPTVAIRQVTGGNFLAVNQFQNVPIDASTFVSVIIAQDTTAVALETGVSGLTASESAQLAEIVILQKIMKNKFITDPTTGTLTIFDDDGSTVLLQANIFEDAAASQAYRGRGVERRERLT